MEENTESVPASQPLELRAHHLLCALTFRSRGYGPGFVQSFSDVIKRICTGESISLTCHADQLCRSEDNCGLCDNAQSAERDKQALKDIQKLLAIDISTQPIQLDDEILVSLRQAFAEGWLRQACEGCAWFSYCSSTAEGNFRRAQLQLNAQ